jgi:hypothetical protein
MASASLVQYALSVCSAVGRSLPPPSALGTTDAGTAKQAIQPSVEVVPAP